MREIKFRAWNPDTKRMFEMTSINCGLNAHGGNILMQYTGLKDKNGKEIWEGDIVDGWGYNWKIVWLGAGFWIVNPLKDDMEMNQNICLESEIIGNIYQNPELIK